MVRRESSAPPRCVVTGAAFANDRNSISVAGLALMKIVEVYKEIQEQEMNIVSTLSSFHSPNQRRDRKRCEKSRNEQTQADLFCLDFTLSLFWLRRVFINSVHANCQLVISCVDYFEYRLVPQYRVRHVSSIRPRLEPPKT